MRRAAVFMEKTLTRLRSWCAGRSKAAIVTMGILLTALVTLFDLATHDFFVLELYIVPLIFVTWFAGSRSGCYMAALTVVAALAVDIIENPYRSSIAVYYWNVAMNLVFFLALVYLVWMLQEALRTQSRFVSTVSHELRTPLAVIKESVLALRDGLLGEVNNRQKEVLDRAALNARRLTRLITGILDFQKIEAGKMALVRSENDIGTIVREACDEIASFIEKKGLSLTVEAGKDLPKVDCDRDLIMQVMTNLLSNAVKFTARGGITVTIMRKKDGVRVGVRDTGRGIRAVDMPRLFKSFEQICEADPVDGRGTGLGLAISKEIVTMHGGRIWADSVYGGGTVFYFTVPARLPERVAF